MRALIVAMALAGCAAADTAAAPDASLDRYVQDASFRRATLESSLVTNDNAYARLRLAKYDETHWGALPELNPETTPLTIDSAESAHPDDGAVWQSSFPDGDDLVAIGKHAFFNYPTQIVATLPKAVASADHAGMWQSEGRTGAVWAKLPGGLVTAFTCATCHASVVSDEAGAPQLVAGRNNPDVDIARMAGDGDRGPNWPRGTVDVTADGVEDPIAITDLRPVGLQANLHHAATLRNDPAALAVRIETLIITSLNESVRPPRKVVAGLTAYLLSLSEAKRGDSAVPASSNTRGREVFTQECASCHHGAETAGSPLVVGEVGTNPLFAESKDRGTGKYRVPSLRFVGDRHRLFASGAVEDLDDLLTPSDTRPAKGHTFGLTLPSADRAALRDYLRGL